MRNLCLVSALAAALVVSAALAQPPAAKKADDQRIAELIRQLGSAKFTERDRAHRDLEEIGTAALPALRKASESNDAETSKRAGDLVRRLEEKEILQNLLAPKRVHLNVKDAPVADAVAALAKQSGYKIELTGDPAVFKDRKVTLDTGETTFWEALDKLCDKAGLMEQGASRGGQVLPGNGLPQGVPGNLKLRPLQRPPAAVPPQAKQDGNGRNFAVQAPPAPAALGQVQGKKLVGPAARGAAKPAAQLPAGRAAPAGGGPAARVVVARADFRAADDSGRPMAAASRDRVIQLADGKAEPMASSYHGAVRVRAKVVTAPALALPGQDPQDRKEISILLETTAEPRLQGFTVVGSPRIGKALDDQGQELAVAEDKQVGDPNAAVARARLAELRARQLAMTAGSSRDSTVVVRLKAGDKQAKTIKELSGSISAQVLAPTEPLITVEKVLQAAGTTAKGKKGGAIKVDSIDKLANGDIKVKLEIEPPPANNPIRGPGGANVQEVQIQIQVIGGGQVVQAFPSTSPNLPALLDGKGRAYQVAGPIETGVQANNGQVIQVLTVTYRPEAGQGDADRLVLSGQRTVTVQVPFSLRNIPLP
jgi:hypothetical protein